MKKNIVVSLVLILLFIGISFGCWSDYKNNFTRIISYKGNNLRISIDGNSVSTLPNSGDYYLVDYDCRDSSTKVKWDKSDYKLTISNRNKKGGITCDLEFKSTPLLSEISVGSYVSYVGDSSNGCDATTVVNGYTSCSGKNVNYVNDSNMGYCSNSDYKYYANGWRVAYIKEGSAYLISAGSTDCMCTSSDGVASNSSCASDLSSTNLYKHINNLNNVALKYCNVNYAKGGVCNNTTSWAMGAADFKEIEGVSTEVNSCYNKYSNLSCGYNNNLIDNGGYYWIAMTQSSGSNIYYWRPTERTVFVNLSGTDNVNGVRPVLVLDSSVVVTGGDGTYESPYQISNNTFFVNDGVSLLNDSDDLASVSLNLISSDDASTMCISINTSVCTNYVAFSNTYTLDLSNESAGENIIYVYYKDASGNIIASINKSVTLNTSS